MHADVLIVTVTKVEGRVVLDIFREATGEEAKPVPIGTKIYHDLGAVNGASVYMVRSEMGAGGLGAAQQTVQKSIDALSPSAIIMVGIAFGIDQGKQSIGDVLVSKQLLLYELQRVGMNKKGKLALIPRGDRPHASPWLIDRFQSAEFTWKEPKAQVRFGLLLSGEKLIDNIDFRRQLRKLEPEAIGGEMEGAGLYVAAQDSKVDWILVKAICDWADGNKERNRAKRQDVAAHNATRFVLHVLRQAPLKVARINRAGSDQPPMAQTDLPAGDSGTVDRPTFPASKPGTPGAQEVPAPDVASETAAPRPTQLAFANIGLNDSAGDFIVSVCVVTDESKRLMGEIDELKARLLRDPLLSETAKRRLKGANLLALFDEPALRPQFLGWLSVTTFSGYLYYAKRAALEQLAAEEINRRFLVEPFVHRMSKKSESIECVWSDRDDVATLLTEAAKTVYDKFRRQVDVPKVTRQRSHGGRALVELAQLVAAICTRHLAMPMNDEATTAFAHVRTRIRFAQDAANGDVHTRDRNLLP